MQIATKDFKRLDEKSIFCGENISKSNTKLNYVSTKQIIPP